MNDINVNCTGTGLGNGIGKGIRSMFFLKLKIRNLKKYKKTALRVKALGNPNLKDLQSI